MLLASNCGKSLWAEAVRKDVYLLNRTITVKSPGKSPYEQWFGHKANLNHVQVFGTTGFVHVAKQKRTKLDSKAEEMILVGYEATCKNYRMYENE